LLIHVPAPHDPFFYDRKTGRPDRTNPTLTNYFDQVALADRSMGELRRAMEQAGLWDSSAVIVTSDHWFRAKPFIGYPRDPRVPFLVKLRGQTQGIRFEEPFNTVVTKEFISDLNQGRVTDAAAWLRAHRGNVTESPYYAN
jgi:arylsulfatase A-like enzyme